MKKVAFVILALSLCFHYCGQKEKTGLEGNKSIPKPDLSSGAATDGPNSGPGERLFIRNVTYNADSLDSQTDLTAFPVLESPEMEDAEFRFQWFVNGEKVLADTGVLEKKYFKKNDWIYCMVTALKDGEMSNVYRGDYIRVPNTPPELVPSPIPMFTVPGTFSYQILASDIDEEPLTFKLLSPLDRGIEVEDTTGWLRWEIDRDLAMRLVSPIVITFEVSDLDGGKVASAITLTFTGAK
jgi:hypothetical protein